jgi:uncharacterized protein YndB with AHSA1/START domain
MTEDHEAVVASGRREDRGDQSLLVLERTFRAPAVDVWAAVTEPERLERWIGTWTGDPASGSVLVRMTAEGEDAPPEVFTIDECDPPRRLVVTSTPPGSDAEWHVEVDLSESAGVTTLTFRQSMPDADLATSVGPGWEYYLDRLVAVETGRDVASVDFDLYLRRMSGHYTELFADLGHAR